MGLAQALAGWHEFYIASAGAAAVLLGLVFIGMSLHYDLRNLDRRLVAMATESAVPFFYATLASLVLLAPVAQPLVPSLGLLMIGLLTALNSWTPVFSRWFAGTARPGAPHPAFDRLRSMIPMLAGLALAVSAVVLLALPEPTLYVIGFIVLVFIAFGMQNAWDILLRRDLRNDATDAPSGPSDG
jgi:hypothetical protein